MQRTLWTVATSSLAVTAFAACVEQGVQSEPAEAIATTKPVFLFAPNGTSTREPRRTASRSSGGIAYVNVPWTATGIATSANSERPDGIGRYCLRRTSASATTMAMAM